MWIVGLVERLTGLLQRLYIFRWQSLVRSPSWLLRVDPDVLVAEIKSRPHGGLELFGQAGSDGGNQGDDEQESHGCTSLGHHAPRSCRKSG